MVGTSEGFGSSTLTQVVATVAENVSQYDPLVISAGGIYKAGTLVESAANVVTGSDRRSVAVAAGNNKVVAISRGYNQGGNSDTGTVYIKAFDVSGGGAMTARGTEQTVSTTVTNPNTKTRVFHLTGDYFAVQYHTADSDGSQDLRIVDCTATNPVLGTAVNPGNNAWHTVEYNAKLYYCTNTTVTEYTRSGTTLSGSGLTFSGAPSVSQRRIVSIGGPASFPHFLFLTENAGAYTIEKYYLSGTTLTYVNSVSISAPPSYHGSDAGVSFANNGTNSQFVMFLDKSVGNSVAQIFYTGAANATTMTASSEIDLGGSSYYGSVGYNERDASFDISYFTGSAIAIRELTTSPGGTSGSLSGNTITIAESTVTDVGLEMAWDSDGDYGVVIQGDYGTDEEVGLNKFSTLKFKATIGYSSDNVTSGQDATIILRRSLSGIQQQAKASGLTLGSNYYLGPDAITTDSAQGPFIGWAINGTDLIVSENVLS